MPVPGIGVGFSVQFYQAVVKSSYKEVPFNIFQDRSAESIGIVDMCIRNVGIVFNLVAIPPLKALGDSTSSLKVLL